MFIKLCHKVYSVSIVDKFLSRGPLFVWAHALWLPGPSAVHGISPGKNTLQRECLFSPSWEIVFKYRTEPQPWCPGPEGRFFTIRASIECKPSVCFYGELTLWTHQLTTISTSSHSFFVKQFVSHIFMHF